MVKKYPRSEAIASQEMSKEIALVSWSGTGNAKIKAIKEWSEAHQEFRGIQRSKGSFIQDFSDLATNVSGRPGLTRSDYYKFRPDEAVPTKIKEIISLADEIYQRVGLIRNIVDLMGDFACQGIRLSHPNKKIEKFYQRWFEKIKGKDRSERFLNNLYRTANVIVRRQTATIKTKVAKQLFRATADPDLEIQQKRIIKKEIPWKYTFLNPIHIEVAGGLIASFSNNPIYGVTLPSDVKRLIKNPKSAAEKALIKDLPAEIKAAAKTNKPVVLDPEKTVVFHYKKDDWQAWARPMIYAIMSNIFILEKLQLADVAALDGAISNIRIFKLGSLEHKIAPRRAAAAKLAEILESHTGVGTMDLIWGPDIELIESKTNVHQFLGGDKYSPTLNSIYAGLGIPQTLTGSADSAGTTNNFISLKTLMQRLAYGRDVLMQFWKNEIEMVQQAMGFRFPAKIEFDLNILGDEASEKALLIQLADRGLISDELIQMHFKNDPDMERIRLNREERARNSGKMVQKASPYHDPQFGMALKKLALQSGQSAPSEIGLRKDAKVNDLKTFELEDGDMSLVDKNNLNEKNNNRELEETRKDQPNKGRPKNAKDKQKRKNRTFKPQVKAVIEIWAQQVQNYISEVLHPIYLNRVNKKSLRSLTNAQWQEIEQIKFGVLFGLKPLQNIDDYVIMEKLGEKSLSAKIMDIYNNWSGEISHQIGRKLTLDELRYLQTYIYANMKEIDNG